MFSLFEVLCFKYILGMVSCLNCVTIILSPLAVHPLGCSLVTTVTLLRGAVVVSSPALLPAFEVAESPARA